ncbi:MAG: M15 family metallopeptidase [Pseudomonadales bacterium]
MQAANLSGQTDSHIVYDADDCGLHKDVWSAFYDLQNDACDAGFELAIASGFRDFERQRSIWNAKATGQRELVDSAGKSLQLDALTPAELMLAILRWSALPGASRHHWGTDFDVYDKRAVTADYRVRLTPDEVGPGGVFADLHRWLDEQLASGNSHGFFRPYRHDSNGIAPEAWHLSYAPIAAECEKQWTAGHISACIHNADIALKDTVLQQFDHIYSRFVQVNAALYPPEYQSLLA